MPWVPVKRADVSVWPRDLCGMEADVRSEVSIFLEYWRYQISLKHCAIVKTVKFLEDSLLKGAPQNSRMWCPPEILCVWFTSIAAVGCFEYLFRSSKFCFPESTWEVCFSFSQRESSAGVTRVRVLGRDFHRILVWRHAPSFHFAFSFFQRLTSHFPSRFSFYFP